MVWCKQEPGSRRVSFSQADTHVGESKTTQSNTGRVCGEKNHQIHVETANLGTRLGFKPPRHFSLDCNSNYFVRVRVYLCARVRSFLFYVLVLLAFCGIAELMDSSCTLWTSQQF